jgi:hypothetical protein
MFWPTWPSSGNTHYVRNTWEEIINIEYYKKKGDLCILYYNDWNKGTVVFATSSSSFGPVCSPETCHMHIKGGFVRSEGSLFEAKGSGTDFL